MVKVSGNIIEAKAFLQNTNNHVGKHGVSDEKGSISEVQKQEVTPAYLLDIQATGEKNITVSGIGTIKASGELKKVSVFCLDRESKLAERIDSARSYTRLAKDLNIDNPYARDKSLTSYLNLEENMKTGGAKAKASYNKAFADIEASAWKEFSYKEKTLSNGVHQYMDGLEKNTGVNVTNSYVANRGNDYDIEYRYGGNICDISKSMLEFMQSHQEHQDIWQNVVKGKYSGFDGIVDALNKSGDTDAGSSLKSLVSAGYGTPTTFTRSSGGEMWGLATGYTRNPDDM